VIPVAGSDVVHTHSSVRTGKWWDSDRADLGVGHLAFCPADAFPDCEGNGPPVRGPIPIRLAAVTDADGDSFPDA